MNNDQLYTLRSLMAGVKSISLAEKTLHTKQVRAGAELKRARLGESLSQKQVAKKIGVSIFRVWTIEEGANLTPELFKQFLDAVDSFSSKRRKSVRRYYKAPKPYSARA
jgi:DNA-binding XRE family transcriptional regulator